MRQVASGLLGEAFHARVLAVAKSCQIIAAMTPGARRPSPCLCLSRPRDNSEETAAADSSERQCQRLKAPLKLRIRSERRAAGDEKGNGVDLGGTAAPFEADHKWDSMGQFSASTACRRQ